MVIMVVIRAASATCSHHFLRLEQHLLGGRRHVGGGAGVARSESSSKSSELEYWLKGKTN